MDHKLDALCFCQEHQSIRASIARKLGMWLTLLFFAPFSECYE